MDKIADYYDEIGFTDWVHEETGTDQLKAQHPEFEMWNQGIHARSGVACADCHMPYTRVGALKISDHHVRSPLLNVTDIHAAKAGGASDADLKAARAAQRRGQFYLDFVESENSNGFHAPQEAVSILGAAIDYFRQGQVSLRPLKAGTPTAGPRKSD